VALEWAGLTWKRRARGEYGDDEWTARVARGVRATVFRTDRIYEAQVEFGREERGIAQAFGPYPTRAEAMTAAAEAARKETA